MVEAGYKVATATQSRIIKTKDGALGFEVTFKFMENNFEQKLKWVGWLKSKDGNTGALERTMKTLIEVLEFNGDEQVEDVPEDDMRYGFLKNQDCINRTKQVQLDVGHEMYDGKEYARIKWVNNIGGGQFSGCSPEVVKNELTAIGFKAAFMAKKAGMPSQKSDEAKAFESASTPKFSKEDLPF